jgi:hypothetical protein
VVLAWTTKDKDEEDELGFGIGTVSEEEEEEGNVQEWRNESEEANIVKLSFKIKNHTLSRAFSLSIGVLSFYYYIIYHISLAFNFTSHLRWIFYFINLNKSL